MLAELASDIVSPILHLFNHAPAEALEDGVVLQASLTGQVVLEACFGNLEEIRVRSSAPSGSTVGLRINCLRVCKWNDQESFVLLQQLQLTSEHEDELLS